MTRLLHVLPGPEEHGVVRHGFGLQGHLDADVLRCERLEALPDGALAGRVVVLQVTDRVLAGSAREALAVWRRVTRGAARLTVVLHDLPQRSDGRSRQDRSELYAALAASADEVVVASHHERLLLAAALRWARPQRPVAEAVLGRTHVIPLPIQAAPRAAARPVEQPGDRPRPTNHDPGAAPHPPEQPASASPLTVVTLGYVYPGKGLEEVVDATALAAQDPRLAGRRVEVRNLGRASDGHEDLVEALAGRAAAAGIAWSTSGWVDDADLPGLLAAADVPVAAHRHLSASGSIATWLGAGRRPLVLASRYADELAERLPGAVVRVPHPSSDGPSSGSRSSGPHSSDVVATLAPAIADALADPSTTWLGGEVELGPSWAEAATALQEVAARPAVSVVVPYYRDQELLDLILERLTAQTGVVGGLEVVVADDGSPEPPDVGAGPGRDLPSLRGSVVSTRVVRQARDGFRAAAARNLGARHACGRVICFLDGDTVPEDAYVAALQQVCLDAPTLALGRRRHADLRGRHTWPPVEPLAEPAWLADGYRVSDDLRAADDSSFRFVISAVMAVSRPVWDAVGGFEEGLTGYGGEDWELGWRCWLAGADLRHVPDAVAWHDGPDLAGREGADAARMAAVKNAETARLAPLLPHPLVRGRGWTHPQPDVVAVVRVDGWSQGQVTVVVEALLRQGDVGVWVVGAHVDAVAADPRVHTGRPAAAMLSRARAVIEVTRPVAVSRLPWEPWPSDLTGALDLARAVDLVGAVEPTGALARDSPSQTGDEISGVRVVSTRQTGRQLLHGEAAQPARLPLAWVDPVPEHVVVEHWRG